MKKKSWVQPADAARYFDVNTSTIKQWIADGKLRAAKLPTGHLRILARDVIKFLLQEGKSIPVELGDLGHKHVLIVDPDHDAADSVAALLRHASGCKVTVAGTAVDARGLLNGVRPDLVLLGVRSHRSNGSDNGVLDMLILAAASEEAPDAGPPQSEVSFRVNEILPTPADERAVAFQVASVLLG